MSVIEVNRGHEQLDVHVNLARSIVASGLPVELLLPEHSSANVEALREGLGLQRFDKSEGWEQLRTPTIPGLTVTVASATGQSGVPADLVGQRLRSGSSGPGLTIIALPPDSSRALRLVSGRLGHAVILIVSEGETRIDQLARLSTELHAVGAVVHGSVLVPRGRRTALPVVEKKTDHSRDGHPKSGRTKRDRADARRS